MPQTWVRRIQHSDMSMARSIHAEVQNEVLVENRRERIIEAAINVIREKSFHLATTRDVAAAANVSQSNLYNYIETKNDILYLVCDHLVALYDKAADDAVALRNDPYERIVEALRAVISIMASHKTELVLLYNEVHALPTNDRRLILARIAKLIDRFQDLLDDYRHQTGEILPVSSRLGANLLSFVPAVLALRYWDLAGRVPDNKVQGQILEFVLAGLRLPLPVRVKVASKKNTTSRKR
jgi:AcrR family transcriptional regulator